MAAAAASAASLSALERPQILEHSTQSFACTVFAVRWIPSSARFVALGEYARGSGMLQVHGISAGKTVQLASTERRLPIKCGTFGASFADERRLACGDFGGNLTVLDLERLDAPVWSVRGHAARLNCIDGCGGLRGAGAPELLTGGEDGCVRLWDTRQRQPVASLNPPPLEAPNQVQRDCWAVCFGNAYNAAERVICSGYDNGDIKLFDLRTNTLRWEENVRNGVVGLQFDRQDIEMNKLVVTVLEKKFFVYDMRTFHAEKGFARVEQKAHDSTVWCCEHLPQNREVWMTTGGNGSCTLWKYRYPEQRRRVDENKVPEGVPGTIEQLNTATFSTQPIVSFDWNRHKEGLCVFAALDQAVRVGMVTKLAQLH